MDIFKVKGLVLNKKDINDSDIYVTFFTQEYGKITAVAYGIRKSKKRSIISLSPLSLSEMTISKKGEYYNIIEMDLIKNYKNIIKDIEKLEISLYILSSVDKIFEIDFQENEFYDKLIEILDYIENIDKLKIGYKYFTIIAFLRRIMFYEGIYDLEEIQKKLGEDLYQKLKKILSLKNRDHFDSYINELKKIVIAFENYINEYLQARLDVSKFIMEEF